MSMIDQVDACVVGAGVIGLAVARQLSLAGLEVLVLEKHARFGEGVSSRNSEVIHAGIYYPAGSLKAQLCVRGKQLLYDYCSRRGVSHARTGKLIVANGEDEAAQLETIRQQGHGNGVDLGFVSSAYIKKVEPAVRADAALLSPSTGIVSAAELMTALLGDIESHGSSLACHAEATAILPGAAGFLVRTAIEGAAFEFQCRLLVNAAGLQAQAVAGSVAGMNSDLIPVLHLCKGTYFMLQGKNPFHHLIYPVPHPTGAGLGVHATIDLSGQVKFGPDVEYISAEDYAVSEERMRLSYAAIRSYFPALKDGQLQPGYAGIRPKLQGPQDPPQDFVIQDEAQHGIKGLVNLFGIESPGLTSSMAIAETVAERLAVHA